MLLAIEPTAGAPGSVATGRCQTLRTVFVIVAILTGGAACPGQILDYDLRQTGPGTVKVERVALRVARPDVPSVDSGSVQWYITLRLPPDPPPLPVTARVELVGGTITQPLTKASYTTFATGQGTMTSVFIAAFPDLQAMQRSLTDGTYRIRYSGFDTTY